MDYSNGSRTPAPVALAPTTPCMFSTAKLGLPLYVLDHLRPGTYRHQSSTTLAIILAAAPSSSMSLVPSLTARSTRRTAKPVSEAIPKRDTGIRQKSAMKKADSPTTAPATTHRGSLAGLVVTRSGWQMA